MQGREWGVASSPVLITYYNKADTGQYILDDSIIPPVKRVGDLLLIIGGVYPPVTIPLTIFNLFRWTAIGINNSIKRDIQSCGGYAQIMQTYNYVDGSIVTVVAGWSTPLIIYGPYGNVSDVQVTRF